MTSPLPGQPGLNQIKSIPAFLLRASGGRELPFLITLLMFDQQRKPTLPPAAASAINRTIDITGRAGLVTLTVWDGAPIGQAIQRSVPQALAIPSSVLLYRCQSSDTAENLMKSLLSAYDITLLKDSPQTT